MRGPEGASSPQKTRNQRSCTPTGDRAWTSLSRLEDGIFRQSDEMVYAPDGLHACEPKVFKTAAVPSRPAPMALDENVLGV